MSRRTVDFLRDVDQGCVRIVEYTTGLNREQVFSDPMRFDGVLHNFHVIGEAVKRLPDELRADHPDIPWKDIAGMRDYIAHAYFVLDLDILWKGIQEDIPTLLEKVKLLISDLEAD